MIPVAPLPDLEAVLPEWVDRLGTLLPVPLECLEDVETSLAAALCNPIGMDGPAGASFRTHETVGIVVPDATRKTGLDQVLPRLILHLEGWGVSPAQISFFFALGVHRPATEEEQARILGPAIYGRFQKRCHNHDAYDAGNLFYAGSTRRGTEVYLNRRACECDHLILTGTVAPHYFAGFGGGRKSLVPGLSGAATIARNHTLNLHPTAPRLDPAARIGALDGNPVAEDLLEAARLHPPDFILNTVLTTGGAIGGLFVGELDVAHRAACALAGRTYCIPIREQADLVVAAIPDAPNFIQSHKALVNAWAALKPEGLIVLYAPAPEGLGGAGYRRYLEMGSPGAVIEALRRQADINGQTALSTLQKGPNTLLVTRMADAEVRLTGAEKADTLEAALVRARERFQARGVHRPTCLAMPAAGMTVPQFTG
ncbi:MAG: hypothetical protein BWX80_01067 [Candidatus Hydrogenedentes bacterium ADurb.Bin101]|nr:MAG: hypothetical protein BWX80_01067 [Candidatus Hydrogenedentes bacterium ADurb.Bin101]